MASTLPGGIPTHINNVEVICHDHASDTIITKDGIIWARPGVLSKNNPFGEPIQVGMTPEAVVKKEIKEVLAEHGAYWYMPVSNGMGSPTLDFLGMHKGWAYAIEAKAPGKKPTDRQKTTMKTMREHGCKVFVIDGSDYSELILWLTSRTA